jgi:hypothetical protein
MSYFDLVFRVRKIEEAMNQDQGWAGARNGCPIGTTVVQLRFAELGTSKTLSPTKG